MGSLPDVVEVARAILEAGPSFLLLARTPQPAVGEHVLASPVRSAILSMARHRPGLTLGELRSGIRLGWGSTYHHVRRLERAGHLRVVRSGRRIVLLPTDAAMSDLMARAAGLLRAAKTARIADDIQRWPGSDVMSIALRTSETPRVVYYQVAQLIRHGLVQSRSESRHFALHPTALLGHLRASAFSVDVAPADR